MIAGFGFLRMAYISIKRGETHGGESSGSKGYSYYVPPVRRSESPLHFKVDLYSGTIIGLAFVISGAICLVDPIYAFANIPVLKKLGFELKAIAA